MLVGLTSIIERTNIEDMNYKIISFCFRSKCFSTNVILANSTGYFVRLSITLPFII